jgi:DnaK suppressor protein
MGLELYEREKNQEIIELLEIELSRVNEALQKVAEGKYGVCDSCGGSIEEERLQRQINPSLCHKCQQAQNNILHQSSIQSHIVVAQQLIGSTYA